MGGSFAFDPRRGRHDGGGAVFVTDIILQNQNRLDSTLFRTDHGFKFGNICPHAKRCPLIQPANWRQSSKRSPIFSKGEVSSPMISDAICPAASCFLYISYNILGNDCG